MYFGTPGLHILGTAPAVREDQQIPASLSHRPSPLLCPAHLPTSSSPTQFYPPWSSSDGALSTCPCPYFSSICCATCCESVTPSCGLAHLLVLDCPFCSFLSLGHDQDCFRADSLAVLSGSHLPWLSWTGMLLPSMNSVLAPAHSTSSPLPLLSLYPRHKDFVLFGGSCHLLQA